MGLLQSCLGLTFAGTKVRKSNPYNIAGGGERGIDWLPQQYFVDCFGWFKLSPVIMRHIAWFPPRQTCLNVGMRLFIFLLKPFIFLGYWLQECPKRTFIKSIKIECAPIAVTLINEHKLYMFTNLVFGDGIGCPIIKTFWPACNWRRTVGAENLLLIGEGFLIGFVLTLCVKPIGFFGGVLVLWFYFCNFHFIDQFSPVNIKEL